MDPRLEEFLARKPEFVSSFPGWMLPEETIDRLRASSRTAIVEIAGRDSVAAPLRAASEERYDLFLPTIAYTGTEFGEWRTPFENVDFLAERLASGGAATEVLSPVLLGAPELWRILCGRYAFASLKRFGFYSPCLGCHLYLHALRIPLAKIIGCDVVIAGERESHDGRVKLNQIPSALETYVEFANRFGVKLTLPLRRVNSGAVVEDLVGNAWPEGEGQLECVLSGNYRDAAGNVTYDGKAVRKFFREFAIPAAERAVTSYLAGGNPGYQTLVADLWPKS